MGPLIFVIRKIENQFTKVEVGELRLKMFRFGEGQGRRSSFINPFKCAKVG